MTESRQKNYDSGLDAVRIVSILAVVLIHTTTRTLETTHYDLVNFPWTLFLNQISRFAVPLFFMISGFSLELSYSEVGGYLGYFKKRASRILIPYLFWSLIYYYLIYLKHSTSVFGAILTGSASYQLYFIPTLFIFYLIFPIIHKIHRLFANKFILAGLGILEIFLLNYDYTKHSLPTPHPVSVALFNYFVFILGIVAARHGEELRKIMEKLKFIVIPIAFALAFYVFFEGKNSYLATYNYLAFYSQWRPSVLFYTILVGGSIHFFASKIQAGQKVLRLLSRLSFFVFFIHVIILEFLWSNIGLAIFHWLNSKSPSFVLFDPSFFITTILISFGVAYIVHKIPNLSQLTG